MSIRKRGIINTFKFVIGDYLFDFVHKVDTNEHMELDDMGDISDKQYAKKYQGSYYIILNKFFDKYKDKVSNSTILDFGSGKGRVLIMAMKYNAKKTIGVEFVKELIDISKSNLDKYKNNNNLTTEYKLIFDNAINYKFTKDENIIFFCNPFNETILKPILKKIMLNANKCIIVYINPTYKTLFDTYFKQIDNFGNELIVYKTV